MGDGALYWRKEEAHRGDAQSGRQKKENEPRRETRGWGILGGRDRGDNVLFSWKRISSWRRISMPTLTFFPPPSPSRWDWQPCQNLSTAHPGTDSAESLSLPPSLLL